MIFMTTELVIIENSGQRVLTTAQMAKTYGTDNKVISKNFTRNADRYTEGKHFICLTGEDLKAFRANRQIDDLPSNINKLYLWTEKGAWLHAKSLNTDKAWDAYELLVDEYYRITEQQNQFALPTTYKEALLQLVEQVEINEQITQELTVTKPKAQYLDNVMQNTNLLTVTLIAKDFGLSGASMNKKLHELGIQYKSGKTWFVYSHYQDKGYVSSYTEIKNGNTFTHTRWTQEGKKFIHDLMKQQGILPTTEKDLLLV